jgi:RNA polymerase-binding transcription factor DksA
MTKAQLEKYRDKLLALGHRLERDATDVAHEALRQTGGEASGSLSNAPMHLADLGTDNFEQEISIGLLENEGMIREQVSDALRRIEAGTYGRCQQCHKEIAAERLDALPYTSVCIDCARAAQEEGAAG